MENTMSAMQNIFGNVPQPVAPTTPGNIPNTAAYTTASVNNMATAPNGAVPASTPTNPDGKTASSAEKYIDLWDIDTNSNTAQGQPLFNVSQEKLFEAAKLQDFKQVVSPEQMQAIAAGGEGAVSAMVEMVNAVAQRSYAQSVFAATKLIDGALEKSNFAKADQLETRMRDVAFKQSLRDVNPVFSSPQYAPFLETAQQQFQRKYPNASADELRTMATDYLQSFAESFAAPQKAQAAARSNPQQDWNKFLADGTF